MATPNHLQRPTYTSSQILKYYDYINLPPEHRHDPDEASRSIARGPKDAALVYLSALQRYTLCAVPFENLDLHYSTHHANSLDPAIIFEKIITRRAGRGGYCMENNNFFGTILRALGFDLYPTGARVNEAQDGGNDRYGGWNHMVNIVTIGSQRYLVDVGFGGSASSTAPLPIVDGHSVAQIKPQRLRLRYTNILDNTSSSMKLWVFEAQNDEDKPFNPVYCFNEHVEFIPADFRVMNYYTSSNKASFFTYRVLVVKLFMNADGEVEGTLVMNEKAVKRRVFGKSELLQTCESEDDRVAALKVHFGIHLSAVEQAGIQGLVTSLG